MRLFAVHLSQAKILGYFATGVTESSLRRYDQSDAHRRIRYGNAGRREIDCRCLNSPVDGPNGKREKQPWNRRGRSRRLLQFEWNVQERRRGRIRAERRRLSSRGGSSTEPS